MPAHPLSHEEVSGAERRSVRKNFRLSEREWALVCAHMRAVGEHNFSDYVRRSLCDSSVEITHVHVVDPHLIEQLARIGNNINQVARWVNVHHEVDVSMLAAIRASLDNIRAIVTSSLPRLPDSSEGDEPWHM